MKKIEKIIRKNMDAYIKETFENYKFYHKDWLDDNFKADERVGFSQWDAFNDCIDSNDWELADIQDFFAYDLGFVCGLRAALEIMAEME